MAEDDLAGAVCIVGNGVPYIAVQYVRVSVAIAGAAACSFFPSVVWDAAGRDAYYPEEVLA